MERVVLSTLIARSQAEVFAFCSDFRNDARWMPGVLESRQASPGPAAPGSLFTHVSASAGRRVELTYTVTGLDPGRRVAVASLSTPFPTEWTLLFEGQGGGTQVRFCGLVHATGIALLAAPALAAAFHGKVRTGLSNLKALLETGGVASTA